MFGRIQLATVGAALAVLCPGCTSDGSSVEGSTGQGSSGVGASEGPAGSVGSESSHGGSAEASTTDDAGSTSGAGSSAGGEGPGSAGDSAGDSGPVLPTVTRYQGEVSEWPILIDAPEVSVDNLPLAQVYYSRDGGESWSSIHARCNGGPWNQRFRDGQISLHETFCTQDVTHYQVVLQEAEANVAGTADPDQPWLSLEHALGAFADPPLATIYSSADGEEWVFDHGACGRVETFELHEDGLRSYTNFCTQDRPFRRVALGTPSTSTSGAYEGTEPLEIADLPVAELPFATLWLGKGQGIAFESFYDCGVDQQTLRIDAEGARLNRNFCSEFAERFVLSIGAE